MVPVFGKYPTSASTSFSPLATADLCFYQTKLGFHCFQPHIMKVRRILSPSLILPVSEEAPLTFHYCYYIILITVTTANLGPPCIPSPYFPRWVSPWQEWSTGSWSSHRKVNHWTAGNLLHQPWESTLSLTMPKLSSGTSLEVQWLRIAAFHCRGHGFNLGLRILVSLDAVWHSQKINLSIFNQNSLQGKIFITWL